MVAFTAIVRFLLATTETMAAPAMLRVVITKMKGRFFMGTLLSSQSIFRLQLSAVYQRCNSGHRDDDFIEFLRRHARGWAVPPKADIELRELNVRQGPIADMGLIRSAYRRAATSLVHRLGCLEINRQLERTRCRSIGKFGGAWRHAI